MVSLDSLGTIPGVSHVQLFVTSWIITHQAPLSVEFFRQEYWSGLPTPSSKGSSRPRDRTRISCISCIDRWILYHCASREAPGSCSSGFNLGSFQEWKLVLHFLIIASSMFASHLYLIRYSQPPLVGAIVLVPYLQKRTLSFRAIQ